MEVTTLAFRFVLVLVFGAAGLAKLLAPRETAQAVANYRLVPASLAAPVAAWLPRLEVAAAGSTAAATAW